MKNENQSSFSQCYLLSILSIPISLTLSFLLFGVSTYINLHWPDIGFPIMTYRELGIPLVLCTSFIAIIRAIDIDSRKK